MKLIAHRGYSSHFPENTIASFDYAIKSGFNFIELDVHLTVDSVLIVMHDPDLDRTTDGVGSIDRTTLEQVKKLDAGSWFESGESNKLDQIQRVPTLEEILLRYSNQAHIYIEIKSGESVLPSILRNILVATNWIDNGVLLNPSSVPGVSIISFDQEQLLRSKNKLPEVSHGLLVVEATDENIETCNATGLGGLFPYVRSASKTIIDKAIDTGLYVGVWGIETALDLEKAQSFGVHGATVNDPIEASRILNNFHQ
jgi:glycerophosphoryl diester phosphodiesterase